MTAYADYTYYSGTFLGTAISAGDFPALALRASAVIDQITFGRAATDTDNTDAIKNAMCAIAEEIQTINNSDGSEYMTSESQGQYSVSWDASSVETRTNNQRYIDAANVWLAGTFLLYPGFAEDEYSA